MDSKRILFVEDSKTDYTLICHSLEKASFPFSSARVWTRKEIAAALDDEWDIVLSDFHLPGLNGFEVLKLIQERAPELPVIVVSGAIAEEDAADLMRKGAKDFVRKDNHARLVPAICRELNELTERKKRAEAEAALAANKELTAKILESTKDSIYVLNGDGFFETESLTQNEGFIRDDGVPITGRFFGDLWRRDEALGSAKEALKKAQDGGVGKFIAQLGLFPTLPRWFHVVMSPIRNSKKDIERILVVARDFTDEKKQEDELSARAAELKRALLLAESANDMKSAFLANISHEIRTPVGAMMGFSDLLAEASITQAEKLEYNGVIQRNGETLVRLLNDVLDISKIEAGHIDLEIEEISVRTLLDDLYKSHILRAEKKGLGLSIKSNVEPTTKVTTDAARLNQIVSNLVGNAIKFTETGTVKVELSIADDGPSSYLEISVSDSGVGISAEDRKKLFRPFSQADGTLTRKFGGTGLGLALSRKLAMALGGDIKIRSSVPGEGTEFIATVSTELSSEKTSVQKSNLPGSPEADALFGMKILVAEDSIDNQLLLKRALAKFGAQVEFAQNGQEALEKARTIPHELLLMDLQMPVLDGLSAARRLRQSGYDKPMIAVTAHAMQSNRLECLDVGFNEHVSKPFDYKKLIAAILKVAHAGAGH